MHNRLVPLWDCLSKSASRVDCATDEDREVFNHRASSEGLPFLTDQLAGLGSIFLSGVRKGYLTKEDFDSARFRLKDGSTLPMFLYSAWSKVFADDGLGVGATFEWHDGLPVLKTWDPPKCSYVAVRWLRQLTSCFSKLQLPHSSDRVQAVLTRFAANEEDLAVLKGRLLTTQVANKTLFPFQGDQQQRLTDVLIRARRLIYKILCNSDPRDISPRHGSGASADSTRPWERYGSILYDPEINAIWPYLEFAAAGEDHRDQILSAENIKVGYPKIARGVFVPKDYRGPRFISCEPATSMYYQQGLMTRLVPDIENHPSSSGFVNFTDQRINQVLAHTGSVTRELASLDLKDASDCLSWDLVVLLWPDHWLKALRAVRSRVTEIAIPGKGTIRVPLRKHAPMGSALCFPVMALTIWALIKSARFSGQRSDAWVYGDDIICASRDAASVCDLLESVGLKVNRNKSFYGPTPFRESCGKEYWAGFDTTPIYCRYNPEHTDTETASLVSFANNHVRARGSIACIPLTQLVHEMTGVPILGLPLHPVEQRPIIWPTYLQDRKYEIGSFVLPVNKVNRECDFTLPPVLWDTMSAVTGDYGQKPAPHLLIGDSTLCMRDQMRKRPARGPGGAYYRKVEYRARLPYPVQTRVCPNNWGYVLRSFLIGGDLGFTESAALAKRVVYKYGWVVVDW